MENLGDMMHNQQKSNSVPNPDFNPADFIQRATGLNIDPSTLPVTPAVEDREDVQEKVDVQEKRVPEYVPNDVPVAHGDTGASTPEAAQKQYSYENAMPDTNIPKQRQQPINPKTAVIGGHERPSDTEEEDTWVKLSGDTTAAGVAQKRIHAMKAKQQDLANLMDSAIAEEEARVKHAQEVTSSPEATRKFLEKGGPINPEGTTPKVKYDNIPIEQRVADRPFNPVAEDADTVESDDLMPSYGMDDTTEETKETPEDPAQKKEADDEAPDIEDEVAYAKYIQGLEVAAVEDGKTVVRTVKNRQLDTDTKDNKSGKFIGDQSFMNSITRFKKDNFTVVSVPMVNSGFILDVVGTGGVDLTQLYTKVSRETSQMDYEIEKMKAVMKNVVGTHPRIDPMHLKKYIHYRDYNMMAWGHICATLDNVEIIANCEDCGKPFRITSSPRSLLMNMDEILQRQSEIEAADDINRYSLLVSNRQIITSNMFEITIGHPNYAEIINQMGQLRKYAQQLGQIEAQHFIEKAQILYQIRQIKLPNGVITSNIYQTYLALTLLADEDYQTLVEEIDTMRKDIIEPKFGIATVKCPHCGHVLHDIPYENLDELVFFHTTVSRMLHIKQTEKPENKSTNG